MSSLGKTILEITLSGVLLGSLYSLAAVGLSLIFGVLKIFNVAHGLILVLSAYINCFIMTQFGLWLPLSVILTISLVFCLGMIINKFAVYPFRRQSERVLLTTLCTGIIIEQSIYLVWGTTYLMTPYTVKWSINIFGVMLPIYRLVILTITLAATFTLWIFLKKTSLGIAIQSTAQDEEAAMMCGVSTTQIWSLTFALSCALAALAGTLLNLILMFTPVYGWEFTLIALAAVTLGGLGNVSRTVVSGLMLGIIEMLVAYFVSPSWRSIVFFLTILTTLIIRAGAVKRA